MRLPGWILEQHREWLGSGGRAGRQASLNGAVLAGGDFRGAKLARADLRGTNLAGADCSGADLSSADLEAADLANANLEGADLSGANLRRCNLQGCRLRGVKGLARAALHDVNCRVPPASTEPSSPAPIWPARACRSRCRSRGA